MGRISAALHCIRRQENSVLDVTLDVLNEQKDKHPEAKSASSDCLLNGPLTKKLAEEEEFEYIDANSIFKAVKKVSGNAGLLETVQEEAC